MEQIEIQGFVLMLEIYYDTLRSVQLRIADIYIIIIIYYGTCKFCSYNP